MAAVHVTINVHISGGNASDGATSVSVTPAADMAAEDAAADRTEPVAKSTEPEALGSLA